MSQPTTRLTQGGNAPLPPGAVTLQIRFASVPAGMEVDCTAYLLTAAGKVRGDADMVFYNQPATPEGGLRLEVAGPDLRFDPARIPTEIERIALCLVLTGGSLQRLTRVTLTVPGGPEYSHDATGGSESALILAELYRRNQDWKLRAIGQGFAEGLAPLARSFGVEVEEPSAPARPPSAPPAPPMPPASAHPATRSAMPPPPPPLPPPAAGAAPPAPPPPLIDLRKQRIESRLVSLEKKDPKLVSLAKTAAVSLAKRGADRGAARVWLVLDVSGSMLPLFKSGAADRLLQRALAFALNLDDDGQIEVILFDDEARHHGAIGAEGYGGFGQRMLADRSLWGTTDYGKAMKLLREHARGESDWGRVPVYVIFVTDGGTENPKLAEAQIQEASREGIFWKFMAIGRMGGGLSFGGRSKRRLPSGFDFLAYLDDMPGRLIDNADFFAVEDPDQPSDAEFYDLMSNEYGSWLDAAAKAGVLRR